MNRLDFKYVVRQLLLVAVILLIAMAVFAIGLTVGYGSLGGGEDTSSILSIDKWQSILAKFGGK